MVIRQEPEEWLKRKTGTTTEEAGSIITSTTPVYRPQPIVYQTQPYYQSNDGFLLAITLGIVAMVAIVALIALKK